MDKRKFDKQCVSVRDLINSASESDLVRCSAVISAVKHSVIEKNSASAKTFDLPDNIAVSIVPVPFFDHLSDHRIICHHSFSPNVVTNYAFTKA